MTQKRTVVGAGLLLGVAGNLLVQGPDTPGPSMLLFFLALATAVWGVTRLAGRTLSREAWFWVAAGVLLSSAFMFRGSPSLQGFAFLGAAAAFAFPALRAGAAWMRGGGVGDVIEAVAGAAGYAGLGALRLATDALSNDAAPTQSEGPRGTGVSAVVRGLLLAVPLLFVFGALFVGADPVFEDLVTKLLGTAMDEGLSHVLMTGIVAWLATGYLTGFLGGTRVRDLVQVRMRRPSLGIVEIGIALGLVCALFTVFIAVQFRYLFGGGGLVEVTPGLTYAEYAREGFGQLAFAAALVIPTLLASDWLLGGPEPRARRVFRTLGSLQLLLLALVLPTLLGALPALPPETRARLAGHLLERWGSDHESDWRSWNLANERARARVRAAGADLEQMVSAPAAAPW